MEDDNDDNDNEKTLIRIPANLLPRCRRVYGWDVALAERALTGYRQFMSFKRQTADYDATLLSPPPMLQRVWQQHILDVHHYAAACEEYCSHLIHHNPDDGVYSLAHGRMGEDLDEDADGRIRATQALVEASSVVLDSDIWSFTAPVDDQEAARRNGKEGAEKLLTRKRLRTEEETNSDNENEDNNSAIKKPGSEPLTIFARRYRRRRAENNDNDNHHHHNHHEPLFTDLYFKILPTTKMSKLFQKFAEHAGMHDPDMYNHHNHNNNGDEPTLTFLFHNQVVQPTDTAYSLGMKETDMMIVSQSAAIEE